MSFGDNPFHSCVFCRMTGATDDDRASINFVQLSYIIYQKSQKSTGKTLQKMLPRWLIMSYRLQHTKNVLVTGKSQVRKNTRPFFAGEYGYDFFCIPQRLNSVS